MSKFRSKFYHRRLYIKNPAAADTIAFHRRYRRRSYCTLSSLLPPQQAPQSRPRRSRPQAAKAARKAQAVSIAAPRRRPIRDKISAAAQCVGSNDVNFKILTALAARHR